MQRLAGRKSELRRGNKKVRLRGEDETTTAEELSARKKEGAVRTSKEITETN